MEHKDSRLGCFLKEKTYMIGSQHFIIIHEYNGTGKIGDMLLNMILKKEISDKQG